MALSHSAVLLAQYLRRHDLTQDRAGKILGIKPAMFSRLLSGKRRPGREMAVRIEHLTSGFVPMVGWDRPPPPDLESEARS